MKKNDDLRFLSTDQRAVYDRLLRRMEVLNFASSTVVNYARPVRDLLIHTGAMPEDMSADEVIDHHPTRQQRRPAPGASLRRSPARHSEQLLPYREAQNLAVQCPKQKHAH